MGEDHKELVQRWIELMDDQRLDEVRELIAPEFRCHFPGVPEPIGRDEYLDNVRDMHRAFEGFRHEIHDLVAEGDRVAGRFTDRGRHVGEFDGIAPTGREIEFTAMSITRFRDGKAVECWIETDMAGLRAQLQGSG